MVKIKYRKYPYLINTFMHFPQCYNELIKEVNQMQQNNRIFIIRPNNLIKVGCMEKNTRKLLALYIQGRDDAENNIQNMLDYLNK